jgi:thiamine-phosphate diphosphorylase
VTGEHTAPPAGPSSPRGVGLHILTSDDIVARPDFVSVAESLLDAAGPRGLLHLRTRQLSDARYVALTTRLARVAESTGSRLIVNARIDIALAGGAHGVHLGRGALSVADARSVYTAALPADGAALACGASVHEVAEAGAADSADWLMAGHVFETRSHEGEPARGLAWLRQVIAVARQPVIAVGGVTLDTVASVRETGAAGVAVLSGIWSASEPKAMVTRYLIEYGDWTVGKQLHTHG